MKSDTQLQKDVLDELTWEPTVSEKEIGVSVKNGVVTLSGYVQSYAQKRAAEKAVARVAGVRAVAEDIQVKLPTSRQRSDTEIAHAAINALTPSRSKPRSRAIANKPAALRPKTLSFRLLSFLSLLCTAH